MEEGSHMSIEKVYLQVDHARRLKDLKKLVDAAIERAGGDEYYYSLGITWKGNVKSITVDTTGVAVGGSAQHDVDSGGNYFGEIR
jgi:hypothetical protein